jgi:hypothetical protein
MKTKSITVETIISGFSHIIWILMLVILLYPINISELIQMLSTISIGGVAILASLSFGASYFIGSLLDRIFADLSSLFKDPPDISELNRASRENKEAAQDYYTSWLLKSFFRSVMFSIPAIVVLGIFIDCKMNTSKAFYFILIIGGIIEILTITAFVTQRVDVKKKLDMLLDRR